MVYLGDSQYAPVLDGHCKTEYKGPIKGTETSKRAMRDAAAFMCQPCDQSIESTTVSTRVIAKTPVPATMATMKNDGGKSRSDKIQSSATSKQMEANGNNSAGQRRSLCRERQAHGTTPDLRLPEDDSIGDGSRSAAGVHSNNQQGEIHSKLSYVNMINGPFFVEVFSGSGRAAHAVRDKGIQAFEFDLTKQGGKRNLQHPSVLRELTELIRHPLCRGIWFGFPCGTFSSARRNDGGPPPLRGTNSKDIYGLPGLSGKELARVRSANALVMRMHELMKICENNGVPWYLENPQHSKLWIHPIIKKWVLHSQTQKVEFDYCQFGDGWTKSRTILVFFKTTSSTRASA